MKIILSNEIQIIEAPELLLRKIRDTFTIENPAYLDNAKMSRWNGGTDHWLTFYLKMAIDDCIMNKFKCLIVNCHHQ